MDSTHGQDEAISNTESRCFLDTAFVRFLLPTIRREVISQLKAFLEAYPNLMSPGGYRTFLRDPAKPTTKFFYPEEKYPNNDTLPGVSSFANFYFESPQEFDLLICEDIRKFLHIISRAGCFPAEQAYNASALKKLYDKFAHSSVITQEDKIDTYHLVKKMLNSFQNTSRDLQDLEVAWIYGICHYLEEKEDPRDDFIEELKSEIEELRGQITKLCSKKDIYDKEDIYFSDEDGNETNAPERYVNETPKEIRLPPKQLNQMPQTLSYSSVAKTKKVYNQTVKVEKMEDEKVDETKSYQRLEYNRKYPQEVQVKFGPIPGKIDRRVVYDTMKRFLGKIGCVQTQYLEPETHLEGNKEVRYGLVVFKREKDASNAINEGVVMVGKDKIKLFKY